MLKNRIIPCLDVKNGRVVKGINFVDLKDAGDPVEQAKIYSDGGADEICFLDITASNENETIYTTDSPEVVKKKINKYAFSGGQPDIEEHRKKGGNPDIDVSFQYLRIFFEPDDKKLQQIHDDYKSGKMLTGELKEILIEKINKFLAIHQQKREDARSQLDEFLFKD